MVLDYEEKGGEKEGSYLWKSRPGPCNFWRSTQTSLIWDCRLEEVKGRKERKETTTS